MINLSHNINFGVFLKIIQGRQKWVYNKVKYEKFNSTVLLSIIGLKVDNMVFCNVNLAKGCSIIEYLRKKAVKMYNDIITSLGHKVMAVSVKQEPDSLFLSNFTTQGKINSKYFFSVDAKVPCYDTIIQKKIQYFSAPLTKFRKIELDLVLVKDLYSNKDFLVLKNKLEMIINNGGYIDIDEYIKSSKLPDISGLKSVLIESSKETGIIKDVMLMKSFILLLS